MSCNEDLPNTRTLMTYFVLLVFAVFAGAMFLCSCTYSINMVHTEGHAQDVVDETQKADADVSPTLSIPASAL